VTIRARIRIALSQVHEARHSGTAPWVEQPLAAAGSSIVGRYPFWQGRLLECVDEGTQICREAPGSAMGGNHE
jgi:hypothetical protein